MATTDAAATVQQEACKQLLAKYFDSLESSGGLLNRMIEDGIIDMGRLNEVLESRLSGVPLESGKGYDLADGTDCKYITVTRNPSGGLRANFSASGSGADYRIRIYNPWKKEWYFGRVPHSYVGGGKRTITIGFRKDGTLSPRWERFFHKEQLSVA